MPEAAVLAVAKVIEPSEVFEVFEAAESGIARAAPGCSPQTHPAAVYLASLSPRSRRTISGDLNAIAALISAGSCDWSSLSWSELRFGHCAALRAELSAKYSHATANRMLSALRGVLRAAWRLQQMPTEEFHRAIDLQPVRGETLPRGRALAADELRALFAVCDDGKNVGRRDQALLGVLYGGGLRRAEAVALNCGDYDKDVGTLKILAGKGNKQRQIPLPPGARNALERWLEVRVAAFGAEKLASRSKNSENDASDDRDGDNRDGDNRDGDNRDGDNRDGDNRDGDNRDGDNHQNIPRQSRAPQNSAATSSAATSSAATSSAATRNFEQAALRQLADQPLFVPITKGKRADSAGEGAGDGRLVPRRLGDQSVMDILLRRARQAGISRVSPHDFRRTYISDLLDAGADIATVQKMAGHASVITTARYDRRGAAAQHKAAHLLHVPST